MLKKIISLSITTLILFQAIHFNLCTSYAVWSPWSNNKASNDRANACERRNKYKGLADVTCAISELEKDLPKQHFAERQKVGENGEYNIYLWDYRAIGDFPSQMGDLLKNAKNGYIYTSAVSNLTDEVGGIINRINKMLSIDDRSSEDIVLEFLSNNEYYSFSKKELAELVRDVKKGEEKGEASTGFFTALGGTLGGIASAGVAKLMAFATAGICGIGAFGAVGIGGACYFGLSWLKKSDEIKQLEEYRIKIHNCASALKLLLKNIQNGNWKGSNAVLAKLNFDPSYYSAAVTMVDSNIEYPEKVREAFEQKFKDLEIELTQMINENKN